MKFTKYYTTILTLTALAFLFIGGSQEMRAQFVPQTDAPQDLRGGEAIESLKPTGGYDSLAEAVKDVNAANQPTVDSLFVPRRKLTANDGALNDFFGVSVAISGDTAVVGAYVDDIGANADQGSAYVFVRSGTSWTQQAKLTASDGAVDDKFGFSLDWTLTLSGAVAVIGAFQDDVAGNLAQGSVYVFTCSQFGTWSQTQKLIASDGAQQNYFGAA